MRIENQKGERKMNIEYKKVGDYYIPDLQISENKKKFNLGKYGRLRLEYLRQNKPFEYKKLVYKNELQEHLIDVESRSKMLYEKIIEELKKKENITEELKAKDQMKWVGLMNNISNCADEIVFERYIYNDEM